ncbi:MAG: hypothetical protein N3D14_04070 [Aquificaceae bacterium]|nr:hypothetical protein [Aquificaceae bacterium]
MRRLLFLIPFVLSMGEPVKDQKLRIELEDKSGLKHSFRGLVCNGRSIIKVREGNVDYSLDFHSIRSLEVLGQDGQQVRVKLSFRNGASKEYSMPATTYCKTDSHIGEASFYIKDVKTIIFNTEEK